MQVLYITHICELPLWPLAIANVNRNNSMPGCFFVCFSSCLVAIVAANLCIHFVFPRVHTSAYCYVRVLDASNEAFFLYGSSCCFIIFYVQFGACYIVMLKGLCSCFLFFTHSCQTAQEDTQDSHCTVKISQCKSTNFSCAR